MEHGKDSLILPGEAVSWDKEARRSERSHVQMLRRTKLRDRTQHMTRLRSPRNVTWLGLWVMRGEETQGAGGTSSSLTISGMYVLPFTHSVICYSESKGMNSYASSVPISLAGLI